MKDLDMKALKNFGISGVNSIVRVEDKDMWRIDDKYFCKTYKDLDCLERVLLIYNELHEAEVPIAVYNKTNTGELYTEFEGLYYTLMDKVAGLHIDYQKDADIFLFGKDFAKLHIGLKNLTDKIKCDTINADLMEQLNGWIIQEITNKNIAIRKEIIDYCMNFDELYHKLPRQIINRDPHGGNILFETGKVSAFLDFDIGEVNARLFDICYCMDLGHGKNIDEIIKQSEKWFDILKKFLSGYNSVSEFKDEELEALPYMFISIQLLTVAFISPDKAVRENAYLNWLYDNRNRILFSQQDMLV